MSVEERLANIERIMLLKYGTLDYETIKKNGEEFRKSLNELEERIKKTGRKIGVFYCKDKIRDCKYYANPDSRCHFNGPCEHKEE